MAPLAYSPSRLQSERAIAAARVALAITSLFAVWIDPAEPARFAGLTYGLHWLYVVYSMLAAAHVWRHWRGGHVLPLATHSLDIVAFSIFQYLTLGPSSPFFVYFVFSLFCGAMRWGWYGTLWTGAFVLAAYLVMGASMSRTLGATEFELNRFIIRTMYLFVAAALLVYLGRYEERLRRDIERLARWPSMIGMDHQRTTEALVEHAAQLLNTSRLAVQWESPDEPWVNIATWSVTDGASVLRKPPGASAKPLLNAAPGGLVEIPFQTERLTGCLYFVVEGTPAEELTPLAEVVAREIGASLDQLFVTAQLGDIAAGEERIRLARDLHDGVLQSLTGIRLELRTLADAPAPGSQRERLLALERALAIEQRELRFFIGDLKPARDLQGDGDSLRDRLHALRERIALEWKTPVTITVGAEQDRLPEAIVRAVPMMVHEAVVNALKHGQPSRVTVAVSVTDRELRILVSDDGRGFRFKGRLDDAALRQSTLGPRSLIERVTAFGGRIAVDSTESGAQVEMTLSL